VSELPFDRHGDDLNEAGCRRVLEMHKVRRRVERGEGANGSVPHAALALRRVGTFQLIVRSTLQPLSLFS
jgi:hypothetical protein